MADHGVVDLTTFQSAISQADLAPLVGTPTENAVVTKLDVIKIQKALSKWVVLPLDKDSGSTYLMCPALFWQRLNKLYSVDTPNYAAVSLNADRILSDITHGLNTCTLAGLPPAAASKRGIPYGYLQPKDKDLENRDRPVVSYFRHPHKAKLRIAGRALMWILQRIQSAGLCSSFSAFDTREYP